MLEIVWTKRKSPPRVLLASSTEKSTSRSSPCSWPLICPALSSTKHTGYNSNCCPLSAVQPLAEKPLITHVKSVASLWKKKVLQYKMLTQCNQHEFAKRTPVIWDQVIRFSLLEDLQCWFYFCTSLWILEMLSFSEGLCQLYWQCIKKELDSISTSSWNVAVVFFSRMIRYLCPGSVQLFRLIFHFKECICKM